MAGSFQGTTTVRTAGGTEPAPVKGTFQSHRGAATVDVSAEALGGTITAKADMRRSFVQRLDLSAPSLDLGRLSPNAKGLASLTLTASGPLDRLSGTGRLEAHDLVWAGATIGTLSADLRGTAGVAQLTLQAPELNVTGEGQLDRRHLVATLHLNHTPLEPLPPLISPGRPLSGIASGTGLLQILSLEPSGSYAVQPTFSDGHNTGIYSWDYLYWLGQNRENLWREYLKRLEQAEASREPGPAPFEPRPKSK